MTDRDDPEIAELRWRSPDGEVIACAEKLKMLRQNLDEIRQVSQDALDDAVLMGCDPEQFREVLVTIVSTLESAYAALEGSDGTRGKRS